MAQRSATRIRFADLVQRPEEAIPLDEAALCIACEDQQGGDPSAGLQQLDGLAEALRPRLRCVAHDPRRIVAALNGFFFGELGFCGNYAEYGDPINSFLDRVIERRTGLPITLSVIYIEVARRLGLPVAGVALPGHFITCYRALNEQIFVDPFNSGRIWSLEECRRHISRTHPNPSVELVAQLLAPPPRRAILARILRNLKHTYIDRGEIELALAAVERVMLLDTDPVEWRDRGLLRLRLGQNHTALFDLDMYARRAQQAEDLERVGVLMHALAGRVVGQS